MSEEVKNRSEILFIYDIRDGNPNGDYIIYWDNGKIHEKGKYVMGQKEGDWVLYDYEGIKIITIRFEDGIEISYDGNKID